MNIIKLFKKISKRKNNSFGNWSIFFEKNIHMYTHNLKINNEKINLDIPCEDLAIKENLIGIWIYNLKVDKELKETLKNILLEWSHLNKVNVRIYIEKDLFVDSITL